MLWLKAFHIMAVVCWFAGIFYLPRIMVYHALSERPETRRQLALMARKLYRFTTPIAYAAIALGAAMLAQTPAYYLSAPWFQLKLLAAALLLAYHHYCGRLTRALGDGAPPRTHAWFRIFNEVPVLFLVAIVLLAVLRPQW